MGKGAGIYVKEGAERHKLGQTGRPRDVRDKLMTAGDVGARPTGY